MEKIKEREYKTEREFLVSLARTIESGLETMGDDPVNVPVLLATIVSLISGRLSGLK